MGLLLLSLRGIQAVVGAFPERRRRAIQVAYTALYLAAFAVVLPKTFYAERQIQTHVEDRVRKNMGLYLVQNVEPGETIVCEPLGYVGYYSRAAVLDWSGRASRQVVAFSENAPEDKRSLGGMLEALRPDYICLRDFMFLLFIDAPWLRENYHPVALFQVDGAMASAIPWIERSVDTSFRVYKKNKPSDELPFMEPYGLDSPSDGGICVRNQIPTISALISHRRFARSSSWDSFEEGAIRDFTKYLPVTSISSGAVAQ